MRFNPCIAIGVADKHRAAADFVALFEGEITDARDDWVEVKSGPYVFYFVQDGTRDLAFSVDVEDEAAAIQRAVERGFVMDEATTERVGETFLLSPDGIRINLSTTG